MKTKEKIKAIVLSRKFISLIIGVLAFCLSDKFTGDHLIIVIGIYCAANVAGKFADNNKSSDQVDVIGCDINNGE